MGIFEVLNVSSILYWGAIFVTLFLTYGYWKMLYFMRHGIPGPFPLPLVGTLFSFTKGFTSDMLAKKNQYGKVYGFSFMGQYLVIHDVDMLQQVMISRFSSFPNHNKSPFDEKPFNRALTTLRDGHWRAIRNTLTPAFTGSKLKQMTPHINECCDHLVEHFDELRKSEGGIQCKDLYGAYSMDVAASSFFGLQIDSQKNPDDPFVKYARQDLVGGLFNPKLLAGIVVPGMAKLYNLLGIQVTNQAVVKFYTSVIDQALALREKEEGKRADVLQMMMDAHELDSKEDKEEDELVQGNLEDGDNAQKSKPALTSEEIMANAVFFLLAGYGTTNTALCMTSYLLATNKEIQEKLIQEVDEIAPKRDDVTYENLNKMEYLDCVVRESLRFYPPTVGSDRVNEKGDVVIKGTLIPKGFSVWIPIYAIHHDPEIWDEPEEFRPERFRKENRAKIHPVSWLPFGDGPRSCIGMRLALMEIKFALVRMLQVFKFDTCPETEIPPVLNKSSAFINPPNGVKLQVVPREETD